MSKKYKVELDTKGVNMLLKSQEIMNELNKQADKVIAAAGQGFEKEGRGYAKRNAIRIKAKTVHDYYSNLKHHKLEKAVGSLGSVKK